MESIEMIRYRYEIGEYNVQQMITLVEKGIITKEEFHDITTLSYFGMTGRW